MTHDQRPIPARDQSRGIARAPAGQPGCKDCGGMGRVHVQVPGKLRVESMPCGCTQHGVCLRCLGKGQVEAVERGTAKGQSLMCSYCQGTGRVMR